MCPTDQFISLPFVFFQRLCNSFIDAKSKHRYRFCNQAGKLKWKHTLPMRPFLPCKIDLFIYPQFYINITFEPMASILLPPSSIIYQATKVITSFTQSAPRPIQTISCKFSLFFYGSVPFQSSSETCSTISVHLFRIFIQAHGQESPGWISLLKLVFFFKIIQKLQCFW